MNKATLRGPSAEVRWAYHRAADLGPWTMTLLDTHGNVSMTAAVISSDAFRVSQQPLTLVVPRPNGNAWRWPIQSLQIAGSTLTASLGPQE